MFYFVLYAFLQCLAASLAWAVIARRGATGAALLEAGGAWAAPLAAAGIAGFSADAVVGVASCGVAFNLLAWALLGGFHGPGGPDRRPPR